jgi:hypothetical protein
MGMQTRKTKHSETDQIDILACNGRHLDISLIQLGQVYTQFLPSLRSNADIILSYAMNSQRDLLALYAECGLGNFKSFSQKIHQVTAKRYDFLLVKNHGGRLLYFHNFKEIDIK